MVETKISIMDTNRCIPQSLIATNADDILYRIGLCPTSLNDRPKRRAIDHPIRAFIVMSIGLIERLISLSIKDEDYRPGVLGFTGYLGVVRRHFDLFMILVLTLSLSSQLIYYWNHINGVRPTFLRLFQMMTGSVAPKDIGLTDELFIHQLCKRTDKCCQILWLNNNYPINGVCLTFSMFLYIVRDRPIVVLMYGIPNSILLSLLGYYYTNMYFFQFLFFLTICSYLKHKINGLNETAKQMIRNKRFANIGGLLRRNHWLCDEINEYDDKYWSKFLFVFWLTSGINLTLILFITIFSSVELLLRLIFVFGVIELTISFITLIFMASSLNLSVYNSYKRCNSLIVCFTQDNKQLRKFRFKSKVLLYLYLLFFLTYTPFHTLSLFIAYVKLLYYK